MASAQVHTEGLRYILEAAFSEEQEVPSNFYVGLCSDSAIAAGASLSDLTEQTGSGYCRQTIASIGSGVSSWLSALDGTDDRKITGTEVTFSATAGDWDEVTFWFLATRDDNNGLLVASGQTEDMPALVGDGEDLDVTVVLRAVG